MNLGAFAVVIAVSRKTHSGEISSFGGLFSYAPGLAVAMTIFFASLAGIPPLGGWFAKFNAFKAVLDAGTTGAYVLAAIAAVNTVIAAAYYMRVLRVVWMDDVPDGDTSPVNPPAPIVAALAITVIGTIVVGVLPNIVARVGALDALTGAFDRLTCDEIRAEIRCLGGDSVRAVHGTRPVRRAGVLHASRRRVGRSAGRLHHVAGDRAAVRCRRRPVPRRRMGAHRPAGRLHRGRRRCRTRHARSLGPRCPPVVHRRAAVRRRRDLRRRSERDIPMASSRVAQLPSGPIDGVVIANELLDNLPFRLAVFDQGWREAFVDLDASGQFVEVLSAPFDPVPSMLPPNPTFGARAPLIDRAAAFVAEARTLVRSGSVVAIDYGAARTALLAGRPWREWLRTYRDNERGDHYLPDPGTQDITIDVPFDQLPEPDAVRSQSQFLQRWGIDELVDEGKRIWTEQASRPGLEAMKMRSRISEAEALLDPTGLGGFLVAEWRKSPTGRIVCPGWRNTSRCWSNCRTGSGDVSGPGSTV